MPAALLALCAALLLAGAPRAAVPSASPAPTSHAKALHRAAVSTRTRSATRSTGRGTAAKAAASAPAPKAAGLPRTLGDVHIEGEIPVPQVLFITAGEPRRFMDFQHHRYLVSSTQLGAATPFPAWVAVIPDSTMRLGKEISR